MRKYAILLAAITIQICLGGIYAWSAFVPSLQAGYGLSVTQTQIIFGLTIAIFTMVMVYAGRLVEVKGPRFVAFFGGTLLGMGYLLASVSGGLFLPLMVGVSLISGAGIGLGYICPLTTSIRWFPKHKGLITGLAVAGFGGGAVLLSSIAENLFATGMDVLIVFRYVGLFYGGLVILASLVLSFPQATERKASQRTFSQRAIFQSPDFWALAGGIFCGTFAGLLVVGNISSIGLSSGINNRLALMAVSTFAIGNAVGRVSWGWIYDRVGPITLPLSLVLLGTAVLSLEFAPSWPAGFPLMAGLVGFGFGACFVLYATQVASVFGIEQVGRVYPYIFLFYGLSGILGPMMGGWLFERSGTYWSAILLATAISYLGALELFILRRPGGSK